MALHETLPRNFETLLRDAPPAQLLAVFKTHAVTATGGVDWSTAIGFLGCPDDLVRHLVAEGLDVDAPDLHGRTPLWIRAQQGRPAQIPLLLSLGADIEARDEGHEGCGPLHAAAVGLHADTVRVLLEHGADARAGAGTPAGTPLLGALQQAESWECADLLEVTEVLLGAGDVVTEEMREQLRELGTSFEHQRDTYSPEELDQIERPLRKLYEIFGIEPVAAHRPHDGVSPIVASPGDREEQFEELFLWLVPATGPARTVQGEVLRIVRVLEDEPPGESEIPRRDRTRMLKELERHLGTGTPLPRAELKEAAGLLKKVRRRFSVFDDIERLAQLTLSWVLRNPSPQPLGPVPYDA